MTDNIETLQRLNEKLDGGGSSLDGIQNAWSEDYRSAEENTFTLASSLGCKICRQYHQNPTVRALEFPLRIDGKTYEYYTVCPKDEEPLFLTEDASYPRMKDVDGPEDLPDQES
ncbi:MAG: hypothetical protein BRC55_16085 [Cyanobacteria bacterium SW_8_48_13]|nr:MAG: hypothetical protein BRC55_16085 [Cyanobacteria bacterium SW_8_48_13]